MVKTEAQFVIHIRKIRSKEIYHRMQLETQTKETSTPEGMNRCRVKNTWRKLPEVL